MREGSHLRLRAIQRELGCQPPEGPSLARAPVAPAGAASPEHVGSGHKPGVERDLDSNLNYASTWRHDFRNINSGVSVSLILERMVPTHHAVCWEEFSSRAPSVSHVTDPVDSAGLLPYTDTRTCKLVQLPLRPPGR